MTTRKKYKDYEAAMEQLELITEQLEAGEPKLEVAIKLYSEGLDIARFCRERLDEACDKIKVISGQSGMFEEKEFDGGNQ